MGGPFCHRLFFGLREIRAIQARDPVHRRGDDRVRQKRNFTPLCERNIKPDQAHHPPRVIRCLLKGLVAATARHGQYFQFRARVREHPGDRVVMTRIAVQNDGYFFHQCSPSIKAPRSAFNRLDLVFSCFASCTQDIEDEADNRCQVRNKRDQVT